MADGRPVSATQWIFGREPLENLAERLGRCGYDGVELSGEPDDLDPRAVRSVLDAHGLTVTSICGLYTDERDLSHPSPKRRAGAVDYVRRCVELAADVGAATVIVVPTAVGRVTPLSERETELELAAVSLADALSRTAGSGVRLVLEALNRFETHLVNTLGAASELLALVDDPRVALMADLFHMNIEERDLAASIREHGARIAHVHLADSNRRPPGAGHTDFGAVLDALASVGYDGALTMEFLPATANPYLAASLDVPRAEKDRAAADAIAHLRGLRAD